MRERMGLTKNHLVALELLNRCGMILRARLPTSPSVGRCQRALSFTVHYSSVIFCNELNLSEGLHV